MVQLKVGDTVTLCCSIRDFCSQTGNFYHIYDINCSSSTACNIITVAFTCLEPSGQEIVFKWVSNPGSDIHDCRSSIVLKNIPGSTFTDNNGIASMQYTVTQEDLNIFNLNHTTFDLMACIVSGGTIISGIRKYNYNDLHVGDDIVIIQNLCATVRCDKPICSGGRLYDPLCDPISGLCKPDFSKLILDPCPTNYIEYDFSYLPAGFRDFLLTKINNLSNWLIVNLPTPSNIVYKKATYTSTSGKFRIYVNYTVPSSSLLYPLHYNNHNINLLSPGVWDWVTSGAQLALDVYARIISSIILFLIAGQFGFEFGLAVGIISFILAGFISIFLIVDIFHQIESPQSVSEPKPSDKVKIIKDFVDNVVVPAANELTPQCACPTPDSSCTVSDMIFYIGGLTTAKYAQCIDAHAQKGDTDTLCTDTIKTKIDNLRNGLNSGTITVQQACIILESDILIPVNQEVDKIITEITCQVDQTWDKTTQKCIDVGEECWLPGPAGGCILSAKTGKTIAIIGAGVIGVYVLLKVFK